MIAPPLLRIGSMSKGFKESNTSQTVSARRNNAAGVAVAKENFRRRPSLSRMATTGAAPSPAFVSGGGSGTATAIFGGASAAGAVVSVAGRAGIGGSGAGDSFGAASGLISILACSAISSDVGGAIAPEFHDGELSLAGLSGAAATGAGRVGTVGAGAAVARACEASATNDGNAAGLSV